MGNREASDHILAGWGEKKKKITYLSSLGFAHNQLDPGLTLLFRMLTEALFKCCIKQLNGFGFSLA